MKKTMMVSFGQEARIMLVHLARRISSFFISKGTIKEEERQIYDYCFEIMLSTILNFCSVMVIAIITKTVFFTLCFIVGFMIIRATAGGYHAETHMACFMILIVSYAIYLIILQSLSNDIISILTIVICIVSVLLISFLAPVEDHNKPLTKAEIKEFKKKSYLAMLSLVIVSILLILCMGNKKWGFSFAAGMFIVSMSLIAGTLKNKIQKCTCIEKNINI